MNLFLLSLTLAFCGFTLPAQAELLAEEHQLPFHLPTPDGWNTETIPFPLSFAPQLDYKGLEEIRFAPGMFKLESEDYWTYTFIWWIPGSTKITSETLQTDLDAYYRGLASQPDNPAIRSQIKAVDVPGGGPLMFEGTLETIDTFVTNDPVSLNIQAEVITCESQNQIAVIFQLSPQPTTHRVWVALHEIRQGFICDHQSEFPKDSLRVDKIYKQNDSVRCGLLDREGILWFGTNNEGVYRYDGNSFINFTKRDGLCDNQVNSMVEDDDGNLWFGTSEGLCKYDGKSFTHVPFPWDENADLWGKGFNAETVLCLMCDKNGNIWFGTWGGGAYRFDGEEFTVFLAGEGRIQPDGLHHNVIQSILEDADGNIWFTSMTHGGVSRFDGTNFLHFMPKDGLSDDMIRSSLQDRSGNLWFGSLGNRKGGLDRFDGKNFTNFNETDGLSDNNVTCIYEDKMGNLWLGSYRGSMSIFDGKTFSKFTTEEGRSFDKIHFFVEDAAGGLWFGGNYGQLYRYDGKTVADFIQKRH